MKQEPWLSAHSKIKKHMKGTDHTGRASHDKLKKHLEEHLDNELQWMLRAATEWFIQEQLHLDIDGYSVQVYALDSACLHARSLFEFFLEPKNKDFLDEPLKSDLYKKWQEPLQRFLMHVFDRSKPKELVLSDGSKNDLNKMPAAFANEVLRLWEEFETKLDKSSDESRRELGRLAREKRKDAITNAKKVINSKVAQCHAAVKGKPLEAPSFLSNLSKH